MQRLYLQMYFGIVGVLLLLVVVFFVFWDDVPIEDAEDRYQLEVLHAIVERLAPPPEAGAAALAESFETLIERLDLHITVYDDAGQRIYQQGPLLTVPEPERAEHHSSRSWNFTTTVAILTDDGRWFVIRPAKPLPEGDLVGAVVVVLLISILVGAYPFARGLTRRLDRLRNEVETLGTGDLSARVRVQGRDVVADLARSFNRTADTIEQLVEAQRHTLAMASHELRSPLARLRVATELIGDSERPELLDGARRDLKELEALIDEILLASRLEHHGWADHVEPVDLLGIVAEESVRVEAETSGDAVILPVEARLVRRLIRNLLENARRHGAGEPIEARVLAATDGGARIEVADRGPGVPEDDREQIFQPFYRSSGWAEGQGGGVGLGLALVRQIAERHAGTAWCEPRPGGGSRFIATLHARELPQPS